LTAKVAVDNLLKSVEDAISNLKGVELKSQVDHRRCPHQFGYLATLPDDSFIPEECFLCSKMTKCILHL
jgi:hypothetical protein